MVIDKRKAARRWRPFDSMLGCISETFANSLANRKQIAVIQKIYQTPPTNRTQGELENQPGHLICIDLSVIGTV